MEKIKSDFTRVELLEFIFTLEDERDEILRKMVRIGKEDFARLEEIDSKIDHFSSLLEKDGSK